MAKQKLNFFVREDSLFTFYPLSIQRRVAISELSVIIQTSNSPAPDSRVTQRANKPSSAARTVYSHSPASKTSRSLSPCHKILEGKTARGYPARLHSKIH